MEKLFFLLAFVFFSGCDIPSAETAVFSYLEIDKMEMLTKQGQGESTSAFSDAWVFLNGKSDGVYELPRRIPLLNEGGIVGSIQAGIRDNGINSTPRVYPFVDIFNFNYELKEGEVLPIVPQYKYLDAVNFRLIDEFNGDHLFGYDEDGIDSIKIIVNNQDEGEIVLLGGEILEEATALVYNEIPQNGSPVYLEIEYKGNLDLDIGLIGISGDNIFKDYFVSLRSENTWKKAYINFTDLILASGFDGYQVLIGADNSAQTTEAIINIDNIKLLHF